MQDENRCVINQLRLTDGERMAVRDLLLDIANDQRNREEDVFLERAALLGHALPMRIKETLYKFKLHEDSVILLITNNPVSPDDVGPTPRSHWRLGENRPLNIPQIMHGLYSSILGEPFGFETQQNGRIFNDLISIPGMQSNSSSGSGDVGLHTEDCYQPFMPDYLGLLCLRNEQKAATTLSSLWQSEIPEPIQHVLFEERFFAKNSSMNSSKSPVKRAVLFGDPNRPYLRYGSIDDDKCDSDAISAMRFISKALEKNRTSITLTQGDCLYVDNFFGVHGRAAYQAEYNSNGRWFCRLVMARDLRKTRGFRSGPAKRIMLKNTY